MIVGPQNELASLERILYIVDVLGGGPGEFEYASEGSLGPTRLLHDVFKIFTRKIITSPITPKEDNMLRLPFPRCI